MVDAARVRIHERLRPGWRLGKWKAEGRPISSEPCRYAPATFVARPPAGLFVDQERVRAAIGDRSTITINALPPEMHSGRGSSHYGRPGRIPGSFNVPYTALIDRQTKALGSLNDASEV